MVSLVGVKSNKENQPQKSYHSYYTTLSCGLQVAMWNRVEKILSRFANQFSRKAAYKWFVTIITGLMIRSDKLGVTSVIRDLRLKPNSYVPMMHFFRADSWKLNEIRKCWHITARQELPLLRKGGRPVLVGDGVKNSKEGRHMPGVKRLAQESETQSKPEFIYGHMWGCVGVLLGSARNLFCTPLTLRIHDGLQGMKKWAGANISDDSHVVQLVKDACQVAQSFEENCLLLLDRYFLSVPALAELKRQNGQNIRQIDIITKAKRTIIAYELPPERKPGTRGAPRKKGDRVKLMELFDTRKQSFRRKKLRLYGKKERVQYYCIDLLWGQKLYQKLRFVLVEYSGTKSILASTDLSLDPKTIISLYGRRYRIEFSFREMKQQLGAFSYRFWTKAFPRLNHYKKKTDPDPLQAVTIESEQQRILNTVRATEMYALMSCIAMGILHALAYNLDPTWLQLMRYQRTPARQVPSEANIMGCLRQTIIPILSQHLDHEIPRLIYSLQVHFDDLCGSEAA